MEKCVSNLDSRWISLTAIHSLFFSFLLTSYPRCAIKLVLQILTKGVQHDLFGIGVSKKLHLYPDYIKEIKKRQVHC